MNNNIRQRLISTSWQWVKKYSTDVSVCCGSVSFNTHFPGQKKLWKASWLTHITPWGIVTMLVFALRPPHLEKIKTNENQHFISDVFAGNEALLWCFRVLYFHLPPPASTCTPLQHLQGLSLNKTQTGRWWPSIPFLSTTQQSLHHAARTSTSEKGLGRRVRFFNCTVT